MSRSWLAPGAESRRGLDRIDDGLVAGTAAIIAGERVTGALLPVRVCWLQQVLRRHQHARRAIAALQRVAVAEGGLQIGDLAAIGQSLDGLNGCTDAPAPPASGRSERCRR